MIKLDESKPEGNQEFCIEKECGKFGFSCRCLYILDDSGNDSDGIVDKLAIRISKEDKSSSLAACFAGNKVGCITMYRNDHIAGSVHIAGV